MLPDDLRKALCSHEWEEPGDLEGTWVHRRNFNFLHQTLGAFPRWIRTTTIGNLGGQAVLRFRPDNRDPIPMTQLRQILPPGFVFIAAEDAFKSYNSVYVRIYGYQLNDFNTRDLLEDLPSRYQYGEPAFACALPPWISLG